MLHAAATLPDHDDLTLPQAIFKTPSLKINQMDSVTLRRPRKMLYNAMC